MGRFDALTQLDKQPKPPTPPPGASPETDPQPLSPRSEKELVQLPTKQPPGKPEKLPTRLHANLQAGKPVNLQAGKDANW